MIRKIFTGFLAVAILAQATVGPTYTIANATETETNANVQMQATSENTGLANNEIIIENSIKDQVYTLALPKQLQLDTKKTTKNVTYDKTKNEITITGTGSKISLFLIASEEGTYELELKEDAKTVTSLNLVVKNQEDKTSKKEKVAGNNILGTDLLKGEAVSDKLSLQAEASKTTLTNYTEQMTVSYSINFLDGAATLKDGKLVIDFTGSGLEPVNYPKNTSENANVKSASYSSTTDKLTINLVNNIPSGAPFDIPVVVRASYDAMPGTPMDLNATLSAGNNSGETYDAVEKAVSVTFAASGEYQAYEPITAGDNSWDFPKNDISFSLMPGGYNITWPQLTKKSTGNKSFKNLKLEYIKENGASVHNITMTGLNIIKPGEYWSSLSAVNGNPVEISNTAEKQVVEFGPINANLYNKVQLTISSKVPTTAVPGTVYTGTVNVYDEDVFVTTINVKTTVPSPKTTIEVDSEVSNTTIAENDTIEWGFTPKITSSMSGVNDLQIVAPIPEGLKTLSFTPNNNNLTSIKKLEYYQDGAWNTMAANTPSGWDLSKINQSNHRIEKLRFTYRDNILTTSDLPPYSPGTIRLQNTGVKAGESFTLQPETITYTDFDQTSKTIDTTTSALKKTIQVVEPTTEPAQINGYVFYPSSVSYSGKEFGSTIFFNGDTISQSVRLGNYANKLANPYIFVIAPKGMDVSLLKNFIQQPYNSEINYTYAPNNGLNTIYPKSSADVSGEEKLADGSTLLYWEAPDTSLSPGVKNCEMLSIDLAFKLNKVSSGEKRIEFGMGSMTDSSWTVNGAGNTGLTTKTLPSELQAKLPGVTSSKYLSTTMTANVGISNSLETKMKIKGSQDEKLVDVSTTTATTIPGKKVDYNLSFKNNGTKSMNNLEIIDILPYVGDQYVLGTGDRGSQFSVIPTSEIDVLINGKKSDTATVEYSTSTEPERFNIDGEDVSGAAWQMTAPTNMADVKSFRIKLPNTEFKVGDQIDLNFEGVVPTDAPRDGEIAYNSVAYRVDKETASGTTKLASEPPRGGVKSTTPATDLSLAGNSFIDLNKNGVQDTGENGLNSVQLDLYKENDGEFEKVETVYTSADSANQINGLFNFVGFSNGTYKIAAHLPNKNAEFITNGDSKVVIDSEDSSIGWLTKNGATEFTIDDLANGNPKFITDLQLPIYMSTPVQGSIIFMNKTGERKITSYGEGYQVALLDKEGHEVKSAVTTNNKGVFSFKDVVIQSPVDYKLQVTAPSGTKFVYAPQNTIFNSTTGTYELNNLTPGVGSTAEIYITDNDLPTTDIQLDSVISPKTITIDSKDAATEVSNKWTVETSNGTLVYEGIGNSIRIPNDEGTYIAKNTATDEAGNTTTDEKSFDIDNTAPVLSMNSDATVEVNSTVAAMNWVNPLTVTATDAHDGNINPTIDYRQVVWDKLGTYPVTVTASDTTGNQSTQTVNIQVVDTIAPTILVTNHSLTYTVEAMRTMTEQDLLNAAGLVGGDNYDLAPGQAPEPNKMPMVFTSDFNTVFSNISTVKKGAYQVQVNLMDSSHNQAIPQTISVQVVDTKAPTLTADDVTYHVNASKTETDFLQDAHVQATDDNDASNDLTITTDFTTKVDLTKPGKYDVTVNATDSSGNTGTKKVIVQVEKDKPVISAAKEMTYQGKTNVTEAKFLSDIQATVTDELDEDVQVTSNFSKKVNQNKVGTYEVTLNAEDSYGNKANPVTVYVQIENKIAPTFQHAIDQTIEATDKQLDLSNIFGIKAMDYMTGESLKITYTPEQPIKGNVPGTYNVKVTTKDTAGNIAETTVTLTIIDTTGPNLTAEKATKQLEVNMKAPNWLTFFGIKANDIVDGDETNQVAVNASEVNLAKLGTYHVYFTVTDKSGNKANTLTTTIQIVDTTLPELMIAKDKINYPKGKAISETKFLQDIGASATDNNGPVTITTNLSKAVNWNQAGTYKVTVTATDSTGNVAKKTIQVTIKGDDSAIAITPNNKGNNQGKGSSSNKNEKNMPETGDRWSTELLFIGIMLLFAGIWLFGRKKTKTK
ncbi:LapB repeat-containing protein [Listeria seeligeri]|uniref:LapB repeat-containing protein n=1 Tax=Listeria seeligeri TaxID=1640 RepID=UPI0031CCD553